MKAEMAVRSISASISAWAARIAPRTISRVTGSQALGCEFRAADCCGMAFYPRWRREIPIPRQSVCAGPVPLSIRLALGPAVGSDTPPSKEFIGGRRGMSEIQYRTAKNVKDAVALMAAARGKGYILAGGTDLLVQMKSGVRE